MPTYGISRPGPGTDFTPTWSNSCSRAVPSRVGAHPATWIERAGARAIGSVVERLVHTEEVTGSNPVSPTEAPLLGADGGHHEDQDDRHGGGHHHQPVVV